MISALQQNTIGYLREALDIPPTFTHWGDAQKLPHAIRTAYDFGQMKLLGESFISLSVQNEADLSPSGVAKHSAWISDRLGQRAVLLVSAMESFNRKRLIERKIPFIVPGNQLYIPDLGLDLREYFKKPNPKPSVLSTFAQLVLLAHLLRNPRINTWTATALAPIFGVSKMTLSRAIDDLENHNLVETRLEGRDKMVFFTRDRKALWEMALPHLRSPVQKQVFLENTGLVLGPLSGLAALAQVSMLASPERQIRAITGKEWKALQTTTVLRLIPKASADLAPLELEIWKYDPKHLSENGMVDPLSLYLSLANTQDERVESALETLLEDVQW